MHRALAPLYRRRRRFSPPPLDHSAYPFGKHSNDVPKRPTP